MKKLLVIFAAVTFSSLLGSCTKSYTCKCTYVARTIGPAIGQPNKVESSTIKSKSLGSAKGDCATKENKYFNQGYDGTCDIQ